VGVTYASGQLPLPNGAYGYGGVGAIYVPGLSPVVEEWSASKSPYYTYGDPVLRNGLVYYLNGAWNGSTIGPPESQVDGGGNRVWSLAYGGTLVEQNYDRLKLKEVVSGPATQWGLRGCHTLMHGAGGGIFEASMQKDSAPAAYGTTSTCFSVDVGAATSTPANLFKLVITRGGSHPSADVGNLVGGIFEYLKDYPDASLGAVYYSSSINYTLTTDNWWMNPEYTEPSPLPTQTFTYTDTSGATINRTKTMWMIFIPETFLGRTYNGAFRVYRSASNPNVLIERMELDTVTPDLNID